MQLGELQKIETELVSLGYQIIALSPDRPEKLKESVAKNKLSYRLFSDSKLDAARSFGLAFRVDDQTVNTYKGYGINLEDASGEKHHLLPVPAVYVVGRSGEIHFEYHDADHRKRIDASALLDAAKKVSKP